MTDMLTAKDIQDMLQVDRSTIYRMAENGRIPAVKVGKQWRFPSDQVDHWLQAHSASPMQSPALPPTPTATPTSQPQPTTGTSGGDLASLLPLACVQLIQDTFADTMGVMLVITDMAGNPITEFSHPCGLFTAISQTPNAVQKCIESWYALANTIDLEPRFMPSHLGLLCARGMIRVGSVLKGMVIVGGIAPENWPPSAEQVQKIAAEFGTEADQLTPHLTEVFTLDETEQSKVLILVQRIANIVAHIVTERHTLMDQLEFAHQNPKGASL